MRPDSVDNHDHKDDYNYNCNDHNEPNDYELRKSQQGGEAAQRGELNSACTFHKGFPSRRNAGDTVSEFLGGLTPFWERVGSSPQFVTRTGALIVHAQPVLSFYVFEVPFGTSAEVSTHTSVEGRIL